MIGGVVGHLVDPPPAAVDELGLGQVSFGIPPGVPHVLRPHVPPVAAQAFIARSVRRQHRIPARQIELAAQRWLVMEIGGPLQARPPAKT